MKKVLVIDDERVFPFERTDVTYARDSTEAIAELFTQKWDEVWFDHDLGETDTGMHVVSWMRGGVLTGLRKWPEYIGRAYVHSMNPVGAENIRAGLADMGVSVFRMPLPMGTTIIGDKS